MTSSLAQNKQARLLDATATEAVQTLCSSIVNGVTPANSLWFELDAALIRENSRESAWLQSSARDLWREIHASNFDAANFDAILDFIIAGWFGLYMDENPDTGGFNFENWPIGQLWCATSKPGGKIDIVYRKYPCSAGQVATEFKDASERVKKAAEKNPHSKVTLLRQIQPNKNGSPDSMFSKNLPFQSVTLEMDTKTILKTSGYHEQPVILPRWMLLENGPYGIGQMFSALPDAKTLNELRFLEMAGADIAVAGMWIATDDGVLNPRAVNIGPRKVIVANSVDSMRALKTGADLNFAFTKAEQLQQSIRRILMARDILPESGQPLTAAEVSVRLGMVRQVLGPVYGRTQSEYLQMIIERAFGIGLRNGMLTRPPPGLRGRKIGIRYISPLARAARMEEVAAIERFNQNLIQTSQLYPQAIDVVDPDKQHRWVADALGVPATTLRTEDEVAVIRKARAEAVARQQQDAAAMEMAKGSGKPKPGMMQ